MNSGENEFIAALSTVANDTVLILTPRQESADKLEKLCKELAPNMPVHVIHSKRPTTNDFSPEQPGIVIANYQGIEKLIEQGTIIPDRFSVLINHGLHADSISQEKLTQLSKQFSNAKLLINHSATSEFIEQSSDVRSISFSPTLKEAVEDYGVLASTKAIVIKSRTLDENNPNAESRDLDKQMMARLSSDPKRTEMLVKLHANYVDEDTGIAFRDQKAVVHCFDIDHAKEVAKKFNKEFGEGTAAALHSGLSSNDQEDLLNKFNRSEIRVLTNVGMAQHLDDSSCTIGYSFVPSRSAALIEKQSQIVMQIPHSAEDIAELQKFQPNRSKQAFVVDFFNEGTQGQVLFSNVIQAAQLNSPQALSESKAPSKELLAGRKNIKNASFLGDSVEILSDASGVLNLTKLIDQAQNQHQDLQENFLGTRKFVDLVKKELASKSKDSGIGELENDLVVSTATDYFNAVSTALSTASFNEDDDNFLNVELNGYRGRFPLNAGLYARGFQMAKENADFAATELGKILEKRRQFIMVGTNASVLFAEIQTYSSATHGQANSLIEDVLKNLKSKKTIICGGQSLGGNDLLVIKNQNANGDPYIFLSENAANAIRNQLKEIQSNAHQPILKWNNPNREFSPPLCLYDAFQHRTPSIPQHLKKARKSVYMFTVGSEAVVGEDGVIGAPRGEGYANNWTIKLPATDTDIRALQAKITQYTQLVSKQLEPRMLEEFDKPLALEALLKKIPEADSEALRKMKFDEAVETIAAKKLLPDDKETIFHDALEAITREKDYNQQRREYRMYMRACDYTKQYQENMAYAEALLIDSLIRQEIILTNPSLVDLGDTGHEAVKAFLANTTTNKEQRNPHLNSEEEAYEYYHKTALNKHLDQVLDFRREMLRESLGAIYSHHFKPENLEELDKRIASTDDVMQPAITNLIAPFVGASMKRLNNGELSSAMQQYESALTQVCSDMTPETLAEAFDKNKSAWHNFMASIDSPKVAYIDGAKAGADDQKPYMLSVIKTFLRDHPVTINLTPTQLPPQVPTILSRVRQNQQLYGNAEDSELPNTIIVSSKEIRPASNISQVRFATAPSDDPVFQAISQAAREQGQTATQVNLNHLFEKEKASRQEMQLFDKLQELPHAILMGIYATDIKFIFDDTKPQDEITYKTIRIRAKDILSLANLTGLSLASTVGVTITDKLLAEAQKEHLSKLVKHTPTAGFKSNTFKRYMQNHFNSQTPQNKVADILSGVQADIINGNTSDLENSARKQIYDLYLHKAEELYGNIELSRSSADIIANQKPSERVGRGNNGPKPKEVIHNLLVRTLLKDEEFKELMVQCRDRQYFVVHSAVEEFLSTVRDQVIESIPGLKNLKSEKTVVERLNPEAPTMLEISEKKDAVNNMELLEFTSKLLEAGYTQSRETLRNLYGESNTFIFDFVEKALGRISQIDDDGLGRFPPYAEMERVSGTKRGRT